MATISPNGVVTESRRGLLPRVDRRSTNGDVSRRSLQERIEASEVGRVLITGFLLATIAAIAVWNLPGSGLSDRLVPVVRPYFNAVGLDQGWGVFAPNPRDFSDDLVGLLEYRDGTVATWHYPTGNAIAAPYRVFRWQKWSEHVTIDERQLWRDAARWVADNNRLDGQLPVRVTLYQRWSSNNDPGKRTLAGPWQQRVLGTLVLDPGAIRAEGL